MKEQEIQLLQAELEARTKELSEKMEQIHQQVRKDLKILHGTKCKCDMFYGVFFIGDICPPAMREITKCKRINPLTSKRFAHSEFLCKFFSHKSCTSIETSSCRVSSGLPNCTEEHKN